MQAGKMKDRVSFQKLVDGAANEFNTVEKGYVTQFTRPAYVYPVPGKQVIESGRQVGMKVAELSLRYDDDTREVTPAWRALFRDEDWKIESVTRMGNKRRTLKIVATDGKAT